MWRAVGLAALIVVIGVFLPEVLASMERFLLLFFEKATELLGQVQF
jgi:hypothetical protein